LGDHSFSKNAVGMKDVNADAEWVRRWEEREVGFRKIVEEARTGYTERVTTLSNSLSEHQAVILKIRNIPLIGNRLVRWAERGELVTRRR
jgi:hypothetical protein